MKKILHTQLIVAHHYRFVRHRQADKDEGDKNELERKRVREGEQFISIVAIKVISPIIN